MGRGPRPEDALLELSQYTFLLRLLSLALIVYVLGVPERASTYALTLLSVGLAVAGALLWRRMHRFVAAHPLLVALDAAVALATLATAGPDSGYWLLSLGPALLVGFTYRPLPAALLGALLGLGYVAVDATSVGDEQVAYGRALIYPALVVGASIVRSRVVRLAAAQRALQLRGAQLEERARLAREMHDSVVKTLHGIALATYALSSAPPREEQVLRDRLAEVSGAATAGAAQARQLLVEMRADQPDRPFLVVLEELVSEWGQEHGLPTQVRSQGLADLDDAVRYELLASLREALDNVAQHARARSLEVHVRADARTVRVEVVDDGVGFDPAREGARARRTGHFGLVGLHERMARVGGDVQVLSGQGSGTRVLLISPREVRG